MRWNPDSESDERFPGSSSSGGDHGVGTDAERPEIWAFVEQWGQVFVGDIDLDVDELLGNSIEVGDVVNSGMDPVDVGRDRDGESLESG